ncbi:hypothetical protein CDV36_000971 [Fusarium kuroshium]|uniref:B30.2/SPRY domain-containing protein n=1 Tax=Fusarium kuroshium TaxID=2010991 RepID=A0A3M2SPB3_9HYPO|nr:hypothetical protein CDV36_000971 [Fusarium kuroshium]
MAVPFYLILVHSITAPEQDENPKSYFSRRFSHALVEDFAFLEGSRVSDHLLQRRACVLLEQVLRSWTSFQQKNHGLVDPLPLVFMGHGLGVALIQQAILSAMEELRYRSIPLHTSAVLFFAAPQEEIDTMVRERELLSLLSAPNLPLTTSLKLIHSLHPELKEVAASFATIPCKSDTVHLLELDRSDQPTKHDRFQFRNQDGISLGPSSGHEQLWKFRDGDEKTEETCKRILAASKKGDLAWQSFTQRLFLLDPHTHQLKLPSSVSPSFSWIRGHQAFVDWQSKLDVRILRVCGPPGSRKAAILSQVLSMLLSKANSRKCAIITFSFSESNIQAQTAFSLYVSLCRQILCKWPDLFQHIAPVWDFLEKREILTAEAFWPLLQSLLTQVLEMKRPVYCLIDGLEECTSSPQRIIKRLAGFTKNKNSQLKLVLSGTDLNAFMDDTDQCLDISTDDAELTAADARQLVLEEIDQLGGENPVWNYLEGSDVAQLARVPSGSPYLLAELRMLLLKGNFQRSTRRSLMEMIKHQPDTIEGAYDRAMDVVQEMNHNWVSTALQWIVHAVRPLKTTEIAVAVAVKEFVADEGDGDLNDLIPWDITDDLRRSVGPLVRVLGNRIYPVHASLRTFLTEGRYAHKVPPDGHYHILMQCIDYLNIVIQRARNSMSTRDGLEAFIPADRELGLLSYACVYWPEHFRRAMAGPMKVDRVAGFLDDDAKVQAWSWFYHQLRPSPPFVKLDSRLKIVCSFGLVELIDNSIHHVQTQKGCEDQLREALDLAAQNGHVDAVQQLLDQGIRSPRAMGLAAAAGSVPVMRCLLSVDTAIDQLDAEGFAPLHHAAYGGHEAVVSYLLEQDSDASLLTSNSSTALHFAARTGHIGIVRILVKAGVLVRAENDAQHDSLMYAAIGGFHAIVAWLLVHGADPNKVDKEGKTALHLAAEHGHAKTAAILLPATRNINARNLREMSPGDVAAKNGHLAVLLLLMEQEQWKDEHGGDTGACGGAMEPGQDPYPNFLKFDGIDPRSPLEWAASSGQFHVVRELLGRKPRPTDECSVALHFAAGQGHTSIVKQLLDHGWTKVALDSKHNTALHAAAQNGHVDVLLELLQHQVGSKLINRPNTAQKVPLHLAAEAGHVKLVDILLTRKADVSLKTEYGQTALHLAVDMKHLEVVKRLLIIRDMIQVQDQRGETAFDLAASTGQLALVEMFIQVLREGDDEDAAIEAGFPLHMAAINHHEGVLRLLLSEGWDHNGLNVDGKTPLQVAAEIDFLVGVELLLGRPGIEKNVRDKSGETPLFTAAYYGKVDIVKALLKSQPPPSWTLTGRFGWTPVHAAFDSPEITKLFMEAKADPNMRAEDGLTVMALASKYHYLQTVEVLLDAQADPNLADNQESTPLHGAALSDNLEIIQLLIEKGKAKIDVTDANGSTALHIAAVHGRCETLLYLIEQGFNMSVKSEKYGTVLAAYVLNPSFCRRVADLLLQKGCLLDEGDEPHPTALQAACAEGTLDAVAWLLDKTAAANVVGGSFGTALCAAVHGNETVEALEPKLSLLLTNGADINLAGHDQLTPLQLAAQKGADEIVHLLLNNGADVNIASLNNDPPLSLAIAGLCSLTTIQAMLDQGADPNAAGNLGKRPLHAAATFSRMDVLELLISRGAQFSMKDGNGRSALMYALVSHSEEIFNYILDNCSPDPTEQDNAGRTPLMTAVLEEDREAVRTLLKPDKGFHGTLDAQDSEGKTALIQAVSLDHQDITQALLDSGANPRVMDCRGRSPLYWASREARFETLEMIAEALKVAPVDEDEFHWKMAVHGAVMSDKRQALQRILDEEGMDASQTLLDGWTPLYTARRYGFSRVEEILLYQLGDELPDTSLLNPSAWHAHDRFPSLKLEPDDRSITVSQHPTYLHRDAQGQGVVRADKPMWPKIKDTVYYFEVQIVTAPKDPILGVGFCDDSAPLDGMLGWDRGSWGYHGDDGTVFDTGKRSWAGIPYGQSYTAGDVVGCGVNFNKSIAFFTLNGAVIGRAFENIRGKLYPAVCFDTGGVDWQIRATFHDGQSDGFMFKGPYDGNDTLEPSKLATVDEGENSD